VRVGLFEHDRAIEPFHFGDVSFGKDVRLEVDDHKKFLVPGSRFDVQDHSRAGTLNFEP
jgi:hypothetical protein